MLELIKIQATLKAPKAHRNNFGGYNYRSCEDILEALKPLCASHNCFVNIFDEIVEVGGRIYVKATATIFNSEGKSVSSVAFAREEETKKGMDAAQVTGSASSYARKYALNGLFAIDDTRDPDTYEGKKKPAQQSNAPQAHKTTITDAYFEDNEKCDTLMKWLYSKYEAGDKKTFDAGRTLARFYNISADNQARANECFKFYIKENKL